MSVNDPNYAPTVSIFFPITVAVSSSASAAAAGVGPFRGVFFKASSSLSITGINGNVLDLNDVPSNTTLWIQGYASVISTATAAFGVI